MYLFLTLFLRATLCRRCACIQEPPLPIRETMQPGEDTEYFSSDYTLVFIF